MHLHLRNKSEGEARLPPPPPPPLNMPANLPFPGRHRKKIKKQYKKKFEKVKYGPALLKNIVRYSPGV